MITSGVGPYFFERVGWGRVGGSAHAKKSGKRWPKKMVRWWVGSHIEWKFSFIPESIRIWDGDVCVRKVFLSSLSSGEVASIKGWQRFIFLLKLNTHFVKFKKKSKKFDLD